jgi:hypothetical protein
MDDRRERRIDADVDALRLGRARSVGYDSATPP